MIQSMIGVLVVDDEALVRKGLQTLLSNAKGINMIAEAATGAEAVALAQEKQPDVVLLDLRLPGSSGLEVAQKLRRRIPASKLLVLTAMRSEAMITQLLDLGVHGYMIKAGDGIELARAIRTVHCGQRYLSPGIATRTALHKITRSGESIFAALSPREMEVLLLLAQGMKINAIAQQLFISPKTVNTYRYRLFEKLGVTNDVGLVMLAVREGLIEVDNV